MCSNACGNGADCPFEVKTWRCDIRGEGHRADRTRLATGGAKDERGEVGAWVCPGPGEAVRAESPQKLLAHSEPAGVGAGVEVPGALTIRGGAAHEHEPVDATMLPIDGLYLEKVEWQIFGSDDETKVDWDQRGQWDRKRGPAEGRDCWPTYSEDTGVRREREHLAALPVCSRSDPRDLDSVVEDGKGLVVDREAARHVGRDVGRLRWSESRRACMPAES